MTVATDVVESGQDRAASALGWLTFACVVATLIVAASLAPVLVNQGAGISETQRSGDLAACRSAYNAELVTGPTASALKALATEGTDSPAFRDAVDRADPERFIALVEQSRVDPDRFLRECRNGSS